MADTFFYCARRLQLAQLQAPEWNAPSPSHAVFTLGEAFACEPLSYRVTANTTQRCSCPTTTLLRQATTDANGDFEVLVPAGTSAFCLSVRLKTEQTECCGECSKCCAKRADVCVGLRRCHSDDAAATVPPECCQCGKRTRQQKFYADFVSAPLSS